MEGGTGMSGEFTNRHRGELTQLKDLSARIGGDPLLTQASTGNTSIKLDDVLWIKASGRWLADAKHEDILVPLDYARSSDTSASKLIPLRFMRVLPLKPPCTRFYPTPWCC